MAVERDCLFHFDDDDKIGVAFKVDSYSVSVYVPDEEVLKRVSVNGIALLYTSDPNTWLVGRIERVIRFVDEANDEHVEDEVILSSVHSVVHVNALGTLRGPTGGVNRPRFSRAVENLPEVGAACFLLTGSRLSAFTSLIADETSESGSPLTLGVYTMAPEAQAIINANAFFQRHAMVVGSTGSGKSWTVARIIEQVASLPSANLLVFDLHGEYEPLSAHRNVKQLRIAGPGDLDEARDDVIYLPYWLLGYEDMLALILDRSDENAPNQAMAFSSAVINAKRKALEVAGMQDVLSTFTIDSPIPYSLDDVVAELEELNTQRVQGSKGLVNGPFHGRFNRFLPRLEAKRTDRRYGFLFSLDSEKLKIGYLNHLVETLMKSSGGGTPGVKIVDFSQVPSDILPIVVSLVARLVFQVQQWSNPKLRHPIALVCDEAHLYLPARDAADASEARALTHFERIAKEGRKYGISLLIISQRPSELNRTIMSQCNNIIALRLSNQADKAAVTNLLPENLGGIQDILPTLGVGEAIVVGDSCPLPSRIKVSPPVYKPSSGSVKFWTIWSNNISHQELGHAIHNMLRQTTGFDEVEIS
jgi:hypothetical protein